MVPTLEGQRQEYLCVQGQPGLHKEFQDSQSYIVRLCLKEEEEGEEREEEEKEEEKEGKKEGKKRRDETRQDKTRQTYKFPHCRNLFLPDLAYPWSYLSSW